MKKLRKSVRAALSATLVAAVAIVPAAMFPASAAPVGVSNFSLPDITSSSLADYNKNGSYDLNVAPGSDATSLGFTWFTPRQGSTQLKLVKASELNADGTIPASAQARYAQQNMVYATENIGQTNEVYSSSGTNVADAALGSDVSGDHADESGNGANWGRSLEQHTTNECSNQITVDSLTPGTQYAYQVSDGQGNWSRVYTIRTLKKDSVSFTAFGDPQIGAFDNGSGKSKSQMGHANVSDDESGWDKVLKLVTGQATKPDFLFSMGDQVNDYNYLIQPSSAVPDGQWYQYNYFFSPLGNTAFQNYPLAAFSGNHDHQMGQYYGYHYNQSTKSSLGATQYGNDGDYWFTAGPVLFLVLNANNYGTAQHDEFTRGAIQKTPNAKWKVAAWHQAAYSEANHGTSNSGDDPVLTIRNTWPKMMDQYGIDVVLQGHDHFYTRTAQMLDGNPVDPATGKAITDAGWLTTDEKTGATTGTSNAKTTYASKEYADSVLNPKGTVYFTLDSGSGSKYYDWNTKADHSFSVKSWQGYVPTYSNVSFTDSTFTIQTYAAENYQDPTKIDSYTITKASQPNPNLAATVSEGNPSTGGTGDDGSDSTGNPKTGHGEASMDLARVGVSMLILSGAAFVALRRKKHA